MMREMVERVAQAMLATPLPRDKPVYESLAVIAITAMRQPTEAMVKAGRSIPVERGAWYEGETADALACWQEMIDAALKERQIPGMGE